MANTGLEPASQKIKKKNKDKKLKQVNGDADAGGAAPSGVTIVDGVATGGNKASRKAALKRHNKKLAKAARAAAGDASPAAAAAEATPSDAPNGLSKKEKKNKRKSAESNGDAPAEPVTDAGTEPGDKQSKKKQKREKKAAAAAAAAAAGPSTDTAAPSANGALTPPATDAADGPITEPKSKKSSKKVKTATPTNGTATADADGEAAAAAAADKKPKKVARAAGAGLSQWMAAVGSKELAAIGKPIVRDLYTEHPFVAATSSADVDKLRSGRATVVEGSDLKPVMQFDHAGFSADLLHATREFVTPSPIQSECWPVACSGRDVVGIAATGSGKTLAFGLPALQHIQAQKAAGVTVGKAPSVLMLSPTRELAMQIAAVMEDAGSRAGLTTVCTYGGVPKHTQAAALRKGVDVIVATPGRLKDLMQDGAARLSGVTYLVLDEADRMLDLGFEPDIRAIASETRADRQTLMFSATWPSAIQRLASEFLCDPVKVTIGSQDLSASHSVTQTVEVINPRERDRRLDQLLKQHHSSRKNRVIVFVLYKKEAARVEQQLNRAGWKAVAVHGDASQQQRTRAVEQFKAGEVPLLIATDVAARGLDIPDVELVINYSFPLTTEDYVHRIGRTGRAGKTGKAHTFFSGETDKPRAGELINVLREANQQVPQELLAFGTTVKKKESKLYGAHFKEVDFSKKASKMTFDSDDE